MFRIRPVFLLLPAFVFLQGAVSETYALNCSAQTVKAAVESGWEPSMIAAICPQYKATLSTMEAKAKLTPAPEAPPAPQPQPPAPQVVGAPSAAPQTVQGCSDYDRADMVLVGIKREVILEMCGDPRPLRRRTRMIPTAQPTPAPPAAEPPPAPAVPPTPRPEPVSKAVEPAPEPEPEPTPEPEPEPTSELTQSAYTQNKTFRMSFSPSYLFLGAPRIQGEFYPSDEVAVGADLMVLNGVITASTYTYNLKWFMPYVKYFLEKGHSAYFGGGYNFGSLTIGTYFASFSGPMFEGGYRWQWETFALDLGYGVLALGKLEDNLGNSVPLSTIGEVQFRLGWAF